MYLSPGIHGVIIVHGVGDQRPGETIADFSKALCDSLINSPKGDIIPSIQLQSDVSGNPPSVTLEITSPYGEKATWVCREAFWNNAFPPPSPTQVLWWAVNQNLREQLSSLFNMLNDPLNEELPTEMERKKEDGKRILGKDTKVTVENKMLAGTQVIAKSGVSFLALAALVPLIYLILGLIWILHFLPAFGPLDTIVRWARKLDPFLSISLGDVQRYVEHEIWSANARARLENIVIGMLKDGEIKDITIVAHSLGAILTYDALTEGNNIAESISKSGTSISKKITFVSVGSAINRLFAMVSPDVSGRRKQNREIRYNELQFNKPLARVITGFGDKNHSGRLEDRFFWLDIFARRDPTPAGPINEHIVKKAGIDPIKQIKDRKVINKDNLFLDHGSYWENKELVMPRIARAINGGDNYPWPEAGITEEKLTRRVRIAVKLGDLFEVISLLLIIGVIAFVVLKLTGTIK